MCLGSRSPIDNPKFSNFGLVIRRACITRKKNKGFRMKGRSSNKSKKWTPTSDLCIDLGIKTFLA
jgi:hypothetical protein